MATGHASTHGYPVWEPVFEQKVAIIVHHGSVASTVGAGELPFQAFGRKLAIRLGNGPDYACGGARSLHALWPAATAEGSRTAS
jgi:hypothetical protein